MSFLNNINPINIQKLNKHLPFTKFTISQFVSWKQIYDCYIKIGPDQLDIDNKISLIKYCLIIGSYNEAYLYLKSMCDPLSLNFLDQTFARYFCNGFECLPSNIVSRFEKISKIHVELNPQFAHIHLSCLLSPLYQYLKQENFEDPNIEIWLLVGHYLLAINVSNKPQILKLKRAKAYDFLTETFTCFLRVALKHGLWYILNYNGFLFNKSVQWVDKLDIQKELKSSILANHRYIVSQKNNNILSSINEAPNLNKLKHYTSIQKLGYKNNLIVLYQLCYNFEFYNNILLCFGINFSCNNPEKIRIRMAIDEHDFLFNSNTDIFKKGAYPTEEKYRNVTSPIYKMVVQKLTNFQKKYPIIFVCDSNLINECEGFEDKHFRHMYHFLRRVIDYINGCYLFIVEEQKYRPGGYGYLEAKEHYNSQGKSKDAITQ